MLTPGRVVLDNAFTLEIPLDGTELVTDVRPSADDTFTLPPVREVAAVIVVAARLALLVTLLELSYEC